MSVTAKTVENLSKDDIGKTVVFDQALCKINSDSSVGTLSGVLDGIFIGKDSSLVVATVGGASYELLEGSLVEVE